MRAVVQRTKKSQVSVAGKIVGTANLGLTVLLGIDAADTIADTKYMADKILNLRIFEDDVGKMNLSLLDIGGDLLVVSQFTLYGDCRKGRRPSFTEAAPPDIAEPLYEEFVSLCREAGVQVGTGQFRTEMEVEMLNWGPVTMLVDSRKMF